MPGRLPSIRKPFPWTECLVILGLGFRAYHYLRNPSMWHDEAALVLNVLGKDFRQLLGPLFFSEAAPPLFLWLEKAVSLVLGEGTYALRLVPFAAGCAALILFARVARRWLQPAAVPWAVLLFACSDHLLWHACEAKSYSLDVLAATVLLNLYGAGGPKRLGRQLILYTLLAPWIVWLVYPGCFLYGGLLLVLLGDVYRRRQWTLWLGYAALALVVVGAFAVLYLGPIRAQHDPTITACWEDMHTFPRWDRPWTVPGWTVVSTLEVFRYASEPAGEVLAPLVLAGLVSLWRRGLRPQLLFLVLPGGLALLGAYVHAYPYAGSRVLVYATPAVLLLVGEGFLLVRDWLAIRTRWAALALTAFLLVPLGKAVQHVVAPWGRPDCAGAAAYVLAHRQPTDLVIGNKWEMLYYFRRLGPDFLSSDDRLTGLAAGQRLWVVLAELDPGRMAAFENNWTPPQDWQILERSEFPQTLILLKERKRTTEGP